jgi:hypothetical protein
MVMGQLEFTEEAGHFIYPDVVSKKVGKKVATTKVKVQVKVTRVYCAAPRFTALVYSSQLHEDLDGAPDAYGENRPGDALQSGLHPREKHLADATAPWQVFQAKGHDFRWTGVVCATAAFAAKHHLKIDNREHLRANGHKSAALHEPHEDPMKAGSYPVVQQTGTTRGYYVSTNNVTLDPQRQLWDQARYGDPTSLAFAVCGTCWQGKDVLLGDVGWCVNPANGNDVSFVFGDSNPSTHVGECSSYMCHELCEGPPRGAMTWVLFPGLRGGKMSDLTAPMMDARVRSEMMKLKTIENGADFARFLSCNGDLREFTRPGPARVLNPRILGPLARMGYSAPIGGFGAANRSVRTA